MPNAQPPTPNAQPPTPNAQRPTPNAQRPTPNARRTVLAPLHEARGAQWMERGGWEIPRCYSSPEQEYEALQEGVGLIDCSEYWKLRITGRDRRTWLNGQVTQDVKALEAGRGAYAAVMTPQGRMVTDLRIYALPDEVLAVGAAGGETRVPAYLDHYLVMERAEIEDLTDSWALLALVGPQSACALATLLGAAVAEMRPWDVRAEQFQEQPVYVVRLPHVGEDGFDLLMPAGAAASLWAALCQSRREFAVHSVGWEALNVRRIEAGIPWWGEELDQSIVPLEARLDHAISRTKGCYVGQEIIARIDARGHVNNLLAGFFVEGERLPDKGSEIRSGGKKVGRVTSAVQSLRLKRPVALGYLRRELQEPGTRVEAVSGEGSIPLQVAALPFIPDDSPRP
jgi:folate-binding protein YgfZ